MGYKCRKATASFGGRDWTAWYAEDIKHPAGPWLLWGLPGLVLDAIDSTKTQYFLAMGIERTARPILFEDKDYFKSPYKTVLKQQARFYEDTGKYLSGSAFQPKDAKTGKPISYPKLAYNGEKLRGSISLPLVFAAEGYRYIDHTLGGSPYRIQQVFPGLEFTAAYLANAGLRLFWTGGMSTDYTQPLSQLLMLPVQTKYDYIRRAIAPQSLLSQTYSSSLLVEFKRPHLGFFSNLNLNGFRRYDEQTINYGISTAGSTTASVVAQRSYSDLLHGKYTVSKYIDAIETKALLEFGVKYLYSPMQLEGRDVGLYDRGYTIRPSLSFSALDWLSLDLGASYSLSDAEVAVQKRRNHTLTIDPSVSVSIGEAWSLECSHQTRWTYGDSYAKPSRLSFLDCQVLYKHKKYKLSLSATNLLGADMYEQSRHSATLLMYERRHLRPREIALSISYKY